MTMKKTAVLAEFVIFTVLFTVLMGGSYEILKYKNYGSGGGLENFYETSVPIDVIAYGSSHAHCTVNNAILWEDYGIPSFTLSGTALTIDGIFDLMEESFRIAPPRIAFVETYTFPVGEHDDKAIYQVGLPSRWSPEYVAYVWREAMRHHWDQTYTEEMLLRMPIVHSRYAKLEKWDFINVEPYMRGYRGSNECTPLPAPVITEERAELPEETLYYMQEMVRLCRKTGVELVFFNAAYEASEGEIASQNTIRDLAKQWGVPYLGFNHDAQAYGIDYATDLREEGHVNDLGAEKITRALADYCETNLQLADHRGEKGYEAWNEHARFMQDRRLQYALEEQTEVNGYLQVLSEAMKDYTVVMTLRGNHNALGEDAYASELIPFDIGPEEYRTGGTRILSEGKTLYSSGEEMTYRKLLEEKCQNDIYVYRDGMDDTDHVTVGGTEYGEGINGLTVLVYDPVCACLVDAVSVDVYQGTEILRPESCE